MNTSDYYVQAIERALGLMRQGAYRQAQNLLQDALDLKLEKLPSDMLKQPEIELAFDPHDIAAPSCWLEETELCINDDGWEMDQVFLAALYMSVGHNIELGMERSEIEQHAAEFLKDGVFTGRVRRKK